MTRTSLLLLGLAAAFGACARPGVAPPAPASAPDGVEVSIPSDGYLAVIERTEGGALVVRVPAARTEAPYAAAGPMVLDLRPSPRYGLRVPRETSWSGPCYESQTTDRGQSFVWTGFCGLTPNLAATQARQAAWRPQGTFGTASNYLVLVSGDAPWSYEAVRRALSRARPASTPAGMAQSVAVALTTVQPVRGVSTTASP
jgi:hypothetical protein